MGKRQGFCRKFEVVCVKFAGDQVQRRGRATEGVEMSRPCTERAFAGVLRAGELPQSPVQGFQALSGARRDLQGIRPRLR